MNIERVEGVEWLRQYSAEWDDLWLRSDVCLPSSRAEPLAWWHEQFSSKWSFRAVLVRDAGKLVAAFPWETRGRWPRTGRLPFNDWFPGGLALVDPAYATREVAELLLDGLAAERCHVSVFRNARWESPCGGDLSKRSRTVVGPCISTRFTKPARSISLALGNNWKPASQRTTDTKCARPGGGPSGRGE